jgi:VanZ family protein
MPLKFNKTWKAIGFGFVVLVIYLSLTPDPVDLGAPEGLKIDHVLVYTWLMLWFAQIYRSTATRFWLAVMFIVLGIALEYLQGLTDYRGFEFSDMLINSFGVALGLLLAHSALQNGLATVEKIFFQSFSRNP